MKLTIKTAKLREMVSKSIKGASNNKMIPITSLMAIQWKADFLTLITTDAANTLKITEKMEGMNFYAVVQTEIFSKLVAKTTTENITLSLKDNCLEVKGNGTYNIELPLDEEGKPIQFPEYKFDHKAAEKTDVGLPLLKSILSANKAAVANTMEVPYLTGYYFDDKVITTDSFKVCSNEVKILPKKMLLPSDLVELLAIMDEEKVVIEVNKNKVLFTTNQVILYGTALDGLDDYPIEAIEAYVQTEFESFCKLPKLPLLNVLDRLLLFVNDYDRNGVYMTFTPDGILFSSKKSNGTELIKYQENENFEAFTCCVDIELLKSQISAQDGEIVEIWYGHERALKMVSGKITQIVALLEDDRAMADGEES